MLLTGPLSSVWKEWIKWCIEFGIEANAIMAVPYDWRLSPSMLEERDLYFHKLKYVYIFASESLTVGQAAILCYDLDSILEFCYNLHVEFQLALHCLTLTRTFIAIV